jgi:hypothetical protein
LLPSEPAAESMLNGGTVMRDVIFIAVTVVFFVVSLLYVNGCERLK